ncbi:MAG: tetratricopeptide repeat protein [Pseudomonadota bacterium]
MTQHGEDEFDRLKGWWQDYGNYLLAGVLFGLALILGWRFYQSHLNGQAVQASEYYEQLKVAVARDDAPSIQALEQTLRERFGSSPYAALGEFEVAHRAVGKEDLATARDALQRALELAKGDPLSDLARVRLAQVQMAQEGPEPALATLKAISHDSPFVALSEEVKGDALRLLGRLDEAREAYRAAQQAAVKAEMDDRLIGLKLKDLGGETS